MIINDIVTQLKYGELRSVASKDDVPAMLTYINLAMVALYGRFKISRKEQIINLEDNISLYTLNDDIMTIEAVYNEVEEVSLNEDDDVFGVFTPSYDTLQVPNASTGTQLSVLYVANPISAVYDTDDATTLSQTIRLPKQLLEPLLHYIGYRAHGSMNGDIKAENNTHYMRYEASCRRILDAGLIRIDVVPRNVNKQEGISDAND